MSKAFNRRKFLTNTAKAGLGIALGSQVLQAGAETLLPALEPYPFQGENT